MNPDLIVAVGSATVSILGAISAALVAHLAARRQSRSEAIAIRRSEVELLRSEVARLHERVETLSRENSDLLGRSADLTQQNATLRATLREHGIAQPNAG